MAEGTSPLTVVANRVAQASLVLTPKFPPRLDSLSPTKGLASKPLFLLGANLAAPPGGTYSVLVDGQPVPKSTLQPGSSMIVLTSLPAWAGPSPTIGVVVDGIAASESLTFTRQAVGSLQLTPATASVATNALLRFTATAYEDLAQTMPIPDVPFTWTLEDQSPAPDPSIGFQPFTLVNGTFQASATGSATVRVEAEGIVATASVLVDRLGGGSAGEEEEPPPEDDLP